MRRALLLVVLGIILLVPALARGSEPAPPAVKPALRITSPLGGQTSERLVTISGETAGIAAERLTLVLNGVPLSIPHGGTSFSTQQVLAPGLNTIRVVATTPGGPVADQVDLYALVPPKDLRITLTWDTPGTDVDLWVTTPSGEKVYYQHKQGQHGGTLDTDVTTGYGPETFTMARAQAGTYRVQAHYFSGAFPSRVTLNVIRGEGTAKEERRTFEGVLLKKDDVVEVGEFVITP